MGKHSDQSFRPSLLLLVTGHYELQGREGRSPEDQRQRRVRVGGDQTAVSSVQRERSSDSAPGRSTFDPVCRPLVNHPFSFALSPCLPSFHPPSLQVFPPSLPPSLHPSPPPPPPLHLSLFPSFLFSYMHLQ